jgi:hypothetical protein
VVKSSSLRWVGNVKSMKVRSGVDKVLVGNVRERDNLEELGVNEILILKGMLRKSVEGRRLHRYGCVRMGFL